VLPGTTPINGVPTKAIQDSDGAIGYFTSDANGIRVHGALDPSPPAGTMTLSPPSVNVRGISPVPDQINNAGTASFSFPDLSPLPFVFNYTTTSAVEAFETITVPAGTFKTLRVRDTSHIFGISQGVPFDDTSVETDWYARHIGVVKWVFTDSDGTETAVLTSTNVRPPLFSATLPGSRSVQVPAPATAFAAIENPSGATATGCSISPLTNLPANFLYQTTDPLTNAVIGTPNTPATIAPEAFQTFVITFTPIAAFAPTTVELQFSCTNTAAATTVTGVNTLLLSASDTPVPDIIAIALTPSGDGITNVPGVTGTNAFSVATANVGAAGLVTASVDTGPATLPLGVSICETDPATGACISPVQSSVVTTIGSNATPTFAIFVGGAGNVPFDPANNRIFVTFQDAGGVTRGSTSVAVRTQ
jgi:hypothetical protein